MMLMKYYKIYDDELCPCGSGKTYLECCKNRKDRPVKKSKKPLNIQIMEQFRKNQIKCCLYPDIRGKYPADRRTCWLLLLRQMRRQSPPRRPAALTSAMPRRSPSP